MNMELATSKASNHDHVEDSNELMLEIVLLS